MILVHAESSHFPEERADDSLMSYFKGTCAMSNNQERAMGGEVPFQVCDSLHGTAPVHKDSISNNHLLTVIASDPDPEENIELWMRKSVTVS